MLRLSARRLVSPVLRRTFASIPEPGPVGLNAGDNPRATLTELYKKTLDAVKEIPEDAAYRTNVEKITNYRLSVITENEDTDEIEATLKIGQMSEIIEQAQHELDLIPHMADWKPWVMQPDQKKAVITIID